MNFLYDEIYTVHTHYKQHRIGVPFQCTIIKDTLYFHYPSPKIRCFERDMAHF